MLLYHEDKELVELYIGWWKTRVPYIRKEMVAYIIEVYRCDVYSSAAAAGLLVEARDDTTLLGAGA